MALQPAKLLANISSDNIVVAISTKLSLDFFALLVVEAFRRSCRNVRFDELPEPGLPKDVWQAGVPM
jgi:hypothetical protein